jgi:hypothetical protein
MKFQFWIYVDSYSDNVDLAKTTHELENELDRIIDQEEKKRVLWWIKKAENKNQTHRV